MGAGRIASRLGREFQAAFGALIALAALAACGALALLGTASALARHQAPAAQTPTPDDQASTPTASAPTASAPAPGGPAPAAPSYGSDWFRWPFATLPARGQLSVGFAPGDAGAPLAGWTPLTTPDATPAAPGTPVVPSAPAAVWTLDEPAELAGVAAAVVSRPGARGQTFNLLALDGHRFVDVGLSVRVRARGGEVDQGGGLAWALTIDPDQPGRALDYFAARWNPLENNLRLYRVRGGVRSMLASAEVAAPADQAHLLTVTHVAHRVVVTLGPPRAALARVEFDDLEGAAAWGPGAVALWTKADADTRFDAFRVRDATPMAKSVQEKLRTDARVLVELAATDAGRAFLAATADLPPPKARVLKFDPEGRRLYSPAQAEGLPAEVRERLAEYPPDDSMYYATRYGSPLVYYHPLDLAAPHLPAADAPGWQGRRVLDFGYGQIGQLRLLASLGAHVVGTDVDPLLPHLYSDPDDTGPIAAARSLGLTEPGSLTLGLGRWPADEPLRTLVAAQGPYDLILSRNTLKHGYVHDTRNLPKPGGRGGSHIDPEADFLGVEPGAFVEAVAASLKPGGVFLIFNLSPAPAKPGERPKPWADGRSPFSREQLEAAGFEVRAFDENIDQPARAMGRALGWHTADFPTDLENDLFGLYTLCVKRADP